MGVKNGRPVPPPGPYGPRERARFPRWKLAGRVASAVSIGTFEQRHLGTARSSYGKRLIPN